MKGDKILVDYANRNHERKEFLHSSGYAGVQNGDNIGVDSAVSFAKRQALDQNREHIQKFQHSLVNAKRNVYNRAKTYEVDKDTQRTDYGASSRQQEPETPDAKSPRFGRPGDDSNSKRPAYGTPRVTPASNAKAPQIPTRRSGI